VLPSHYHHVLIVSSYYHQCNHCYHYHPTYHHGIHCVTIRVLTVSSSYYHQDTQCVTIPLSLRYSLCYSIIRVLCYHPTIRVLTVLSSYYHQCNHCYHPTIITVLSLCYIILSSGYSLCYHPPTIRVRIVLPSHYHYGTLLSYHCHRGTHCGIIPLSSGYSWGSFFCS
jgi:hypothetical protein